MLLVLIGILVIGPLSQAVQGSESHSNFDRASKDLSMLYDSLEDSKEGMEGTLESHVNVNYSLKRGEERLALDFFNQSYQEEALQRALNHTGDVENSLQGFHRVYRDIEEKDVPSYGYLRENYLPFYKFSKNLTSFSISHHGLIKNLTKVTISINNQTDGNSSADMINGLRSFHNASYLAKNMREELEGMNRSLDEMNDRFFELDTLKALVEQCYSMVNNYSKNLENLVPFFENTPPYITMYHPEEVHYGEHFTVEGFYVKGGEYVEDTMIDIFKDGNRTDAARTDSSGYYEVNMTVGWDPEINNISLYSSSKEGEVFSKRVTVDVIPWESQLKAESTKEAYYDEWVMIEGELALDAPVDVSGLEITSLDNRSVSPNDNGSFQAVYDSKAFRWGRSEITLRFKGNQTVKGDMAQVSIEVSIPTELEIIKGPKKMYSGSNDSFLIIARLVNKSSKTGVEEQNVSLTIDNEEVKSRYTEKNGTVSFTVQLQEIEEGKFHSAMLVFQGGRVHRSCSSIEMGFQIKKQDEDKGFKLFENKLIPLGLLLVIGSVAAAYYYHKREEKEEPKKMERVKRSKDTPRVKKGVDQIPSASGPDDINRAYAKLMNILDHSNVIRVTKGKTHRDLGREINDALGLREEVGSMTSIFEKVYFREESATSTEIEQFNLSIERIIQEVGA